MTSNRRCRGATIVVAALLLAGATPPLVRTAGADPEPAAPPPVAWQNLREAKAQARHRDQPLLVFFAAGGHSSSLRMDRETWSDRRLRGYLDGWLVTARVESQDSPAVAAHFGVPDPPAVLFLAPDGRRLAMLRGFAGPESVLQVSRFIATRAYEYTDYDTWLSRNPDR